MIEGDEDMMDAFWPDSLFMIRKEARSDAGSTIVGRVDPVGEAQTSGVGTKALVDARVDALSCPSGFCRAPTRFCPHS